MSDQTPAPENPDELLAKRVQMFIDVRDKIAMIDEDAERRKKPLVEAKNLLEGWITNFMTKTGAQSVRTKIGQTAFFSSRASASVADADAFMRHVIGAQAWELLERRASAAAVEDFIKANGEAPPGVNFNRMRTLSVRKGKPSGK